MHNDLSDHFRALAAVHPAAEWLWPALVEAMLAAKPKPWTVEQTRAAVARLKELPAEAPVWLTDNFAQDLADGTIG
jgi:hypothetical protein